MTGKNDKSKKLTHKDISIQRLSNLLTTQANYVMNSDLDTFDKADELDVILNTIKFLSEYDENIEALNKYIDEHRFERKFRQALESKYDELGNLKEQPSDHNGDERE